MKKIELPEQAWAYIIQSLGSRPYNEVVGIISLIGRQLQEPQVTVESANGEETSN
jgi:hypothetical protein